MFLGKKNSFRPVGPRSFYRNYKPAPPPGPFKSKYTIAKEDQTLKIVISPDRMRSLNIFIIFLFAVFSFFIIPSALGGNPRMNNSLIMQLMIFVYWSGMAFFILRLVAAKEIVVLDPQKLTVTKKLLLTFSTINVPSMQVRAMMLTRFFERDSGPIVVVGIDQEIEFGKWLTDDGSAREIFDLLSDRLKVKKFRRRLQVLPKPERTFFGPNAKWIIEKLGEDREQNSVLP